MAVGAPVPVVVAPFLINTALRVDDYFLELPLTLPFVHSGERSHVPLNVFGNFKSRFFAVHARRWAGSVRSLVFKAVVEFAADVVFANPNAAPDNHIKNRSDLCIVVVGDSFALTKKSAFGFLFINKLSLIAL